MTGVGRSLRPGPWIDGTQQLRSPLRFALVATDGSLRGGQTGDGHAERRAGHVVHADAVAELDGARLAAVLAADADFQVRVGLAAAFDGSFHQLADAFVVEDGGGIVGENLAIPGRSASRVLALPAKA